VAARSPREERRAGAAHGVYEQTAIEVVVTPFAGGLGREQAGVAGRAVQYPAVARVVFRAERVGAAQAGRVQCLVDELAESVTLAERYQAAERALTVRGGGVEQHTRASRVRGH